MHCYTLLPTLRRPQINQKLALKVDSELMCNHDYVYVWCSCLQVLPWMYHRDEAARLVQRDVNIAIR